MESNVELPLESQLFLEQVKRYIADLEDAAKLRELTLQAIAGTKMAQHLSNLLVIEVRKNETLWEQRFAEIEQKCASYEAVIKHLACKINGY